MHTRKQGWNAAHERTKTRPTVYTKNCTDNEIKVTSEQGKQPALVGKHTGQEVNTDKSQSTQII